MFTAAHLDRMQGIMRDVCADFGAGLAGFNGEPEQVHLLVNFPPAVTISRLIHSLNGVSSHRLRHEFPDLRRHYWRATRLWSGSYFAGPTGGGDRGSGKGVHADTWLSAMRRMAFRVAATALR